MTPFKIPYTVYDRVQIHFKEKSLTKQAMKDECDINKIMAQMQKTGMTDHVNTHQGNYGDFTEVQDYQTSMNQVIAARDAFETLPAKVRARFRNSPAEFFEFVDDSENEDEMRELGLLPKKAPEAPKVASNIAGSPAQHTAPLDVSVLTDTTPPQTGAPQDATT